MVDVSGQVSGDTYAEEPGRDYRKERDLAYTERNLLVSALASVFLWAGWRAWLAPHPPDPEWDPAWTTIVFLEGPTGQMSWHLHDLDVPLFAMLKTGANTWDGHSTEEKYRRLGLLHSLAERP